MAAGAGAGVGGREPGDVAGIAQPLIQMASTATPVSRMAPKGDKTRFVTQARVSHLSSK